MGQFIAKLTELFVQGNKGTILKLLVVILLVIIILPMGLNYFYENVKIEQKIRILKELLVIDKDKIDDVRLKEYYNTILNSLNKNEKSFLGITIVNDSPKSNIYKFISGAIWWLLLFIIGFFIKQDTIGLKIAVQIIFLVFVFIFGIIGVKIPSFSIFAINIIGYPLIQIIIIILIVLGVNRFKNKSKN